MPRHEKGDGNYMWFLKHGAIAFIFFKLSYISFTVLLNKVSRNSHLLMSFKIGILKNSVNFTGKHLCWILF